MNSISDITEGELRAVGTTLEGRHGRDADAGPGDAEIRLDVSDRELTGCPVIHRHADGCHLVVFETRRRSRAESFYRGFPLYGTGVREHDDPTGCVVSLLQAQAAQERGDSPEGRR